MTMHDVIAIIRIAPVLWPIMTTAQMLPPAYKLAATQAGIPAEVLYAIALQESGITLQGQHRPWPWTLNVAGRSQFFSTKADACAALSLAHRRFRATRIDVGLAQLNLGYQRAHYSAPCDLLDPGYNLAVAAYLLRRHRRFGEGWLPAIGRYHRPAGGAPAARYRRSVNAHLKTLQWDEQP